jgi:glutathione S-transferase
MLHVYGFPFTRSTRAVWALEEAGAEYGYTPVNLMKGENRRPEYLQVNPGGKVPALIDGDLVLTESAAICTFIGEKFPDSGLVPQDSAGRAHYFRWCFFAMSELETPLWTMAKYTRLYPEKLRVPAVTDTCLWEFSKAGGVLAQHLENREFAVGSHFTAADILLCSTLNWARASEIPLPSATLAAYADRLSARPALARAREREAKAAGA